MIALMTLRIFSTTKSEDGIARITIARPQIHNAFRPQTVKEMMKALADARYDERVGVIILTSLGEKAFCSGGDQKIRGDYGGYKDDSGTHHFERIGFPAPNTNMPQACYCVRRGLGCWRWSCAAYDV